MERLPCIDERLAGRVYRALVIGTGGHRVAVRGILRRVARLAATSSSFSCH